MKQKEYTVSSRFVACELQTLKKKLEACTIKEKGEKETCDVPFTVGSAKKISPPID